MDLSIDDANHPQNPRKAKRKSRQDAQQLQQAIRILEGGSKSHPADSLYKKIFFKLHTPVKFSSASGNAV